MKWNEVIVKQINYKRDAMAIYHCHRNIQNDKMSNIDRRLIEMQTHKFKNGKQIMFFSSRFFAYKMAFKDKNVCLYLK